MQRIGGRTPIVVAGDSAADEEFPAFSPDGQRIVFSRAGGLFVVEATGENVRRVGITERSGAAKDVPPLVAAGAESGFDFPRVARDDGRLVFRARSLIQNPTVADLDVRQRTLPNARALSSRAVTWQVTDVSADGRTLAIYSQEPPADIWVVDRDGKNLRQVTSDGANNRLPRFTADGRLVF